MIQLRYRICNPADSAVGHIVNPRHWLFLLMSLVFYLGQLFISKIVFLQKAPEQEGQSRFICFRETVFGLDNRRVFHVTLYFLLFLNFLLGLLSCFLRIGKALVIGAIYIGRIDRCVMMRGWELWDRGYGAYMGFLQLEVAHTHPVLITFCHFLQQKSLESDPSSRISTTNEFISNVNAQVESGSFLQSSKVRGHYPGARTYRQLSRRMRNKWLVALTLTRNPTLVAERKGALNRTRTVSSISDNAI
ncbi:stimulated by retinoic acid gene 6 protein-like [Patiria miniata]|uniref:Uncharacterized protein n=1 Tax=Patiria miniata TaxID=46514 RepID=A0A914B257_PATMI|nr:stimulated by retinoic acid gene 6 protein-like [Patiria miniata]